MFLFDIHRSGRQNFESSDKNPEVSFKTDLRTNPVYGAESTAAIDQDGNLYFGSHSGNFYCLNPKGEIVWTFTTEEKIYSSPIFQNDLVFFGGGDGYLYCLKKTGDLLWKFDLSIIDGKMMKKKVLNKWAHFPFTYDFDKKRNIIFKCWSSPNYLEDRIYITGYGKGLYCFDLQGNVRWSYDLGFPRYQLSGVVIDENERIYVSSRSGKIFCFEKDGKLVWEKEVKKNWEPWGNPVVCTIKKQIYFFFSLKEKKGLIHVTDYNGKVIWEKNPGSIRGSCCISWNGNEVFCGDLDGYLYKLNSANGETITKKKITNCPRGLWITPTIDKKGNLLLATKDSKHTGRVIKLDPDFNFIWEFKTNKVLSIPIIKANGEILFGSWDGNYYCVK